MELVMSPKGSRGLGIVDLELQNRCLLSKWLFQLLNEDGMWQNLLRNKYMGNKTMSQMVAKPTNSHFWTGLLKVKHQFRSCRSFILKDGSLICFWEDKWLGIWPLKELYPNLYNVSYEPYATVKHVMSGDPYNLSFRRSLVGVKLTEWANLLPNVSVINLSEERDTIWGGLSMSGIFTARSMYTISRTKVRPSDISSFRNSTYRLK